MKDFNDIKQVVRITETTNDEIFNNEYEYYKRMTITRNINYNKQAIDIQSDIALKLNDKTMQRDLTPFDKVVHNSVCTLWEAGITTFTTEQVYKIIVGNMKAHFNRNSTNKLKESIEESLRMLANIYIGIDFEDENDLFGIYVLSDEGNQIVKLSSYLLALENTVERCPDNHLNIEVWKLLKIPPLYNYALIKRQVENITLQQLNIPLKLTPDNLKLREFLLGRIIVIKNNTLLNGHLNRKYRNCNIINFDKIYELFDIDMKDRSSEVTKKKKRLLEKCETMFNFWMNDTGMLKSWKYNYDAKDTETKIGYKLYFNIDKFKISNKEIEKENLGISKMKDMEE